MQQGRAAPQPVTRAWNWDVGLDVLSMAMPLQLLCLVVRRLRVHQQLLPQHLQRGLDQGGLVRLRRHGGTCSWCIGRRRPQRAA